MNLSQFKALSTSDSRSRIIDAALLCLEQWGPDKTSINDLAKQAGVTRPTVYKYFPNKEEIFQAALLHVGQRFGGKLFAHFNQFDKTEKRLVEAMAFTYENLPNEPYLGLAIKESMVGQLNKRALSSQESLEIRLFLFAEILQHDADLLEDLEAITDFCTRILLSLLTMEGSKQLNSDELRAYLNRFIPKAVFNQII